jgi:hypothetical protein
MVIMNITPKSCFNFECDERVDQILTAKQKMSANNSTAMFSSCWLIVINKQHWQWVHDRETDYLTASEKPGISLVLLLLFAWELNFLSPTLFNDLRCYRRVRNRRKYISTTGAENSTWGQAWYYPRARGRELAAHSTGWTKNIAWVHVLYYPRARRGELAVHSTGWTKNIS